MRYVVEMDEHEGFRDSALNATVMQVFHDAVEEGVNHPLASRVPYRFLVEGKQASACCINFVTAMPTIVHPRLSPRPLRVRACLLKRRFHL